MKIGIIDSGLGGEYIGEFLKRYIDCEIIMYQPVYFTSYSNMSMDDLVCRCETHINYLKSHEVDIVVIGCMTISTNLTRFIRRHMDGIPVYDMCEFLPEFNEDTMIIATTNTIKSGVFDKYFTIATPDLSTAIEKKCERLIPSYLAGYESSIKYIPVVKRVLLGCTHYSVCKEIFDAYYKRCEVIDLIPYLIEGVIKNIDEQFYKISNDKFVNSECQRYSWLPNYEVFYKQ